MNPVILSISPHVRPLVLVVALAVLAVLLVVLLGLAVSGMSVGVQTPDDAMLAPFRWVPLKSTLA